MGLERPLGLQETEAPRISRQSTHEGVKVFSPTHQPPLPSRIYTLYSFCHRMSQPQGLTAARRIKSIKTAETTSEVDHATSRLVAHCLNQLRHRVPLQKSRLILNTFCQYSGVNLLRGMIKMGTYELRKFSQVFALWLIDALRDFKGTSLDVLTVPEKPTC